MALDYYIQKFDPSVNISGKQHIIFAVVKLYSETVMSIADSMPSSMSQIKRSKIYKKILDLDVLSEGLQSYKNLHQIAFKFYEKCEL